MAKRGGRGARWRYRREWLLTAVSALLFAYMVGLVLVTLAWSVAYSLPQWILIGVMVTGSAVLLAWQVRKVRGLRRSHDR
ncbi:hypothetical protein [Microbacterium sp. LMC-P-041]|uniref:hypothetical protein n=1 Tax=Microbacterium sp. LMC-P-041 TaxID=3040293 RepID=UPI0025520F7B|nr:hypothetical protein [Microbacterium sp. LMC-P-041]